MSVCTRRVWVRYIIFAHCSCARRAGVEVSRDSSEFHGVVAAHESTAGRLRKCYCIGTCRRASSTTLSSPCFRNIGATTTPSCHFKKELANYQTRTTRRRRLVRESDMLRSREACVMQRSACRPASSLTNVILGRIGKWRMMPSTHLPSKCQDPLLV